MPTTKPPVSHPIESSDERLDEALAETFPASDPIAVDPTEPAKRIRPTRPTGKTPQSEAQRRSRGN